MENSEEISHDLTGTHSQKYLVCSGAELDGYTGIPRRTSGRPASPTGSTGSIHSGTTPENTTTPGITAGISTALATLERYTRELGAALVALERLVERQIERAQEFQRQRSRGPGLGR